jgi:integrase
MSGKSNGCNLWLRGRVWYLTFMTDAGRVTRSTGCTDRADAIVAAAEMLGRLDPSSPVVYDYGVGVIDRLEAMGQVERSTIYDYRKSWVAWRPILGAATFASMTRELVEDGVATMLREGRAATTVNKRLTMMKMVTRDALERGKASSNVAANVRRPKIRHDGPGAVSGERRERLKRLLDLQEPTPEVTAACLALYAGLRGEECVGLKVSDLEIGERLWVRRSVGREGPNEYVKGPKNDRARDVPMCDALSAALGRYLSWRGTRDGWLLLGDDGERLGVCHLRQWWSKFASANGLVTDAGGKLTFHGLRHTFATACVAAGMDVATLSAILGHASASITLDVYVSPDREAKDAARSVIDRAV